MDSNSLVVVCRADQEQRTVMRLGVARAQDQHSIVPYSTHVSNLRPLDTVFAAWVENNGRIDHGWMTYRGASRAHGEAVAKMTPLYRPNEFFTVPIYGYSGRPRTQFFGFQASENGVHRSFPGNAPQSYTVRPNTPLRAVVADE